MTMPNECEVCAIHRETSAELSAEVKRVQTQLDDLRRDVELAIRTIDTQQATPTMNRGRVLEVTRGRLATGLATTEPARGRR